MGWNEAQYGYIVTSFQVAYALGLLVMALWLIESAVALDTVIAVAIWSVSAMVHSLAGGYHVRDGAVWARVWRIWQFPERAQNGCRMVSPEGAGARHWHLQFWNQHRCDVCAATHGAMDRCSPWLAIPYAYDGAFSAIWIACWLKIYRRPQEDAKLSTAELDYIQSDPPETVPKIPWARLLYHRQGMGVHWESF